MRDSNPDVLRPPDSQISGVGLGMNDALPMRSSLWLSHTCYSCSMPEIASRELRNSTRSLLDRVESGETLTITVDGRPTAVLAPIGRRPRWVPRHEFASILLAHQADPGLAEDLEELAGEMTGDLPPG